MTRPAEQDTGVSSELDLRGEICPYTFVKTKLALEALPSGQVLRVVVDNEESGENVPRSVRCEGHHVLQVSRLNPSDWVILVRKA